MPVLDPASPLARVLAADRARYNALVAAARGGGATVDPGDFAALLADTLAPIADAVHAAAPERLAAAVSAIYPIALDLLGRRVLGPESRHPEVGEGWRRLLPALPRLVAAAPAETAGAVTNALHALSGVPGARPEAWIERMAAVGPPCADLPALRDAGAVVAWQSGLAHLRVSALAAAGRLPASVASAALGLGEVSDEAVPAAVERLREDPWLDPAGAFREAANPRSLRIVARAGAFRGFGGPFLAPPTVRSSGGALYASDRDGTWRLHADRFGAVFQRVAGQEVPPPQGRDAVRVDAVGKVRFAGSEDLFPELADPTSCAAIGVTAAVTVLRSHVVTLLALM